MVGREGANFKYSFLSRFWGHNVTESIEIQLEKHASNRDSGLQLNRFLETHEMIFCMVSLVTINYSLAWTIEDGSLMSLLCVYLQKDSC